MASGIIGISIFIVSRNNHLFLLMGGTDPKRTDWAALLRTVGLDAIAKEPIVEVMR